MNSKEQQALEALITLIDSGVEFPDAVWQVSQKFAIDGETLAALYDEGEP